MWEFWSRLFDTRGFEEPWQSGSAWTQGMGVGLMLANLATALAYFAIPLVIIYFLIRRNHVRWSRLWFLFFVALVVGGLAHLLSATAFWWPVYRFHLVVDVTMAVVSWIAIVLLIPLVPKLLEGKSIEEFSHLLSKHEEAEQALRETEAVYKSLIESLPLNVFRKDLAGPLRRCQPAVLRHARQAAEARFSARPTPTFSPPSSARSIAATTRT